MLDGAAESERPRKPRVLLIEDDCQVRHAYARVLRAQGIDVHELQDGRNVSLALEAEPFDAVVSDICMPGPSGIDVLRAVRGVDPDLPVLLVTAGGDLTSAVEAVEHGAHRYLLKPVTPSVLGDAVTDAVRIRRLAAMQRRAFELYGSAAVKESGVRELSERFEHALRTLHIAYQPIVSFNERRVFAHEALVRCDEPSLLSPDLLLAAADTLGRGFELGRQIRRTVAEQLARDDGCIFVNLHPRDLDDPELTSVDSPLAQHAFRVVLEVTERASLEHAVDLRARLARLRQLGYRLAVDDLGAGYAGLTWFTQIEPEVVKLDMSLTRNVHEEATKRRLIRTMTVLCRELGIQVVAEGVEKAEERDALVSLGCTFLQGYLFARPGPAYPVPSL
jgi:EAL domain-containing protein (putative c-di-GMP-specific phosphodiesterase class I)/ActR/RegA family two-component response regulator